jgi:NADPH:quinone reductase-like Zn-dependent oxidoreductase
MATGIGGAQGSLAQFAVVDARLLAHKPGNLSMRETAGLPLVLITAWEGLVDRARVRAGQKVLIHGGAGGVGHVAVQIARAFGAEVFATGSAGQQTIIESFGATFIDYRKSSVEDYVAEHTGGEGFDIVYDTVGGETLDASFKAARVYEGHVVSCLGWGQHSLAPLSFRAATYSGVFTLLPLLTGKGGEHHGQILRDAAKLIEAGKLKPLLDPRQFTLQTAEAAHELLAGGAAQGRLVIEI